MDAYDRCTNLGKKILRIALPSVVEAEKFSDQTQFSYKKKGLNKSKSTSQRVLSQK